MGLKENLEIWALKVGMLLHLQIEKKILIRSEFVTDVEIPGELGWWFGFGVQWSFLAYV